VRQENHKLTSTPSPTVQLISYKHSNLGHWDELIVFSKTLHGLITIAFKKTKADKKVDESLTETTEAQLKESTGWGQLHM